LKQHTKQASNTWSAEASFVTPPADAVADPNTEARILLTADAGQYAPDNAYMPDGCAHKQRLAFLGMHACPRSK
jgi:hypothetical protein